MPLTHRITFKTTVKKQNRIAIPKILRWQYKLESSEVLKVTVSVEGTMGVRESFLGKMRKDGRIAIPQLQLALLRRNEPSLEDFALEVMLEPV
jgi:hypothetical protein